MKKTLVSSQDFRNLYEKFYNRIRNYLWPLSTLKILADVEVDIYSAFIDYKSLDQHLQKLYPLIKEQIEDDEFLSKAYYELDDMLDEVMKNPDADLYRYMRLHQVQEVNPELDKTLLVEEEEVDENNKELGSESF